MKSLFQKSLRPLGPITIPEIAEHLVDIPQALRKIYSSYLGGTVTANEFRNLMPAGFAGVMAWFCLDSSDNSDPKPFLAFESMPQGFVYPENDEIKSLNLRPVSDHLLVPTRLFPHNFNIPNHEDFVRTHVDTPPSGDLILTKAEVTPYLNNFVISTMLHPYQKYPHAYLDDKENHLSNFLAQPGVTHVRYYFGFSSLMHPNMIRVILIPVKANGANISVLPTGMESTMLQKSVPPPPY